jgi:hypothetical protein
MVALVLQVHARSLNKMPYLPALDHMRTLQRSLSPLHLLLQHPLLLLVLLLQSPHLKLLRPQHRIEYTASFLNLRHPLRSERLSFRYFSLLRLRLVFIRLSRPACAIEPVGVHLQRF